MTTVDILVVGAGPAGIGAGARLRAAGFDFLVAERAAAVGGTWRDNNYPGCACDIASSLYSFSFAPNPDWKRAYAAQPEIRGYLERTAAEFGVLPSVRFGTDVGSAEWDGSAWRVQTSTGPITARVLVTATGPWSEPLVPDLPGLDSFPGEVFHSARWNHDYDLRGKRVAVVGTGASSVQFLPLVQPEVARLHLFQRTAPWVLPKADYRLSAFERGLFRRFPLVQRWHRALHYGSLEALSYFFRHPRAMRVLQRAGLWNIRRAVRDPRLREMLTPDFVMGCKRVLLSNTYYPALTRSNVEVVPHGIARVSGSSVVGSDGTEREVDAIIFGTGFHYSDPPIAERVFGADGRSLAQVWRGSPQAYLGTSVHGFPNLFMLLGPNMGSGTGSAIGSIEAQLRYLLDAVERMRAEGWHSVEVREPVQARYNAEVQHALATTVYNAGGCVSNYHDRNGRNSTVWPWSTVRMNRRIRDFTPSEYLATSVENGQTGPRSL